MPVGDFLTGDSLTCILILIRVPGRRIEGNDFLGIVESIEDLKSNKPEVRTFEFAPGYVNEMIALIADADEWRLSRVYAVRGQIRRG